MAKATAITRRPNKVKPIAKRKQSFGIAEWYGNLYRSLSDAERRELVEVPFRGRDCPYLAQVPALGPKNGSVACNKKGGVCSLRNFHDPVNAEDLTFGEITTTCPNRFLEHGLIISHIANVVLGTSNPLFAKELPFLKRPRSPMAQQAVEDTEEDEAEGLFDEVLVESGNELAEPGREDVGRIDLVLVDSADAGRWCAVEMQAVYFSGKAMSSDMTAIRKHSGNGIPRPGATRRPDFRSSGPKRLMPQLMIKVPSLRRWGKKMVVVIDKPFFDAMDNMLPVEDISNCDIVWVVVSHDETSEFGKANLFIHKTFLTTLEEAVKGLTSGEPTTLSDFEDNLGARIRPAFPSVG